MVNNNAPRIGILAWEGGLVPPGLMQLEKLKGNSTNVESYDYPVLIRRVEGASAETIVLNPDEAVLQRMVSVMEEMIGEGVKAITTSCGFNAIHQKRLADSVDVPVFTSSLMQIPFVLRTLKEGQSVVVITARKASLTPLHFKNCGVAASDPVHVMGMEEWQEWEKVLDSKVPVVDMDLIEKEIIEAGFLAKKQYPDVGAFVLECTDMPPFARAIREATGLPVFDFITLVNYVNEAI
ncbi:MAG: aspartate/glutamate racemase family protein [Synergistales bacterium]|nr:aspartate/glutamate racemase family protein [Synergistales bacterium]